MVLHDGNMVGCPGTQEGPECSAQACTKGSYYFDEQSLKRAVRTTHFSGPKGSEKDLDPDDIFQYFGVFLGYPGGHFVYRKPLPY